MFMFIFILHKVVFFMVKRTQISSLIVFISLLAGILSIVPSGYVLAASCPFSSQAGRTIVNFDGSGLASDGSALHETSATAGSVPAATYDIWLASYDDHSAETTTEDYEQWLLYMKNGDGSIIGTTKEISDLADGENYRTEKVNSDYRVMRSIATVTAHHVTAYDSNRNSVTPVCVAFDLKGGSPLVATYAAVSIGDKEATLRGYVNPNGTSNTARWFEWGTNTSLDHKTLEKSMAYEQSISEIVAGLTKDTQYYFRTAARNTNGTSYGPTLSFMTSGANIPTSTPTPFPTFSPTPTPTLTPTPTPSPQQYAPTATTQLPTYVAQTTAILNGHITADGQVSTNAWFEWGTQSSLGYATSQKNVGYIYATDVNSSLTGLVPNTLYYFRAVAENARGRSYGSTFLFRTLPVSTPTPTPIPTLTPTPTPYPPVHTPTPIPPMPSPSPNASSALATLTIEPSDKVIDAGSAIAFKIAYENISKDLLVNAVLTVTLPPELTYQDMSGSSEGLEKNASMNPSLHVITVQIGDMIQGQKGTLQVHTLLKSDTIDRKIFTTSVVITYADTVTKKDGKETAFAVNTARTVGSSFAGALFAGGCGSWLLFAGLALLLLIIFIIVLLKRRRDEEEEKEKKAQAKFQG